MEVYVFVYLLFVICNNYFLVSYGFLNIEELQEMRYSLDILHKPISSAEADFSEGMQLASKHGQQYFCKLPTRALEMEKRHHIEEKLPRDFPIVKLLEPLTNEPCLKIVKGWWTYEFCFMKSLRQYHIEGGKPVGEIINLGFHGSDFDWDDERKIKAKMFKTKRIQKYHTQYYVNGTECSVINHKRDTEVRYYCDESAGVPYIERIDEPSTCSYIITVKTNLICSHPHTRITYKSKPVEVVCRPMLSPESFQTFEDQKAKAELAAYEEASLLLKQKRDRLRQLLLTLKDETRSDPFIESSEPDDSGQDTSKIDESNKQVTDEEKVEEVDENVRELAIDFIHRFVSEEKIVKLSRATRKEFLKETMRTITLYKSLPSADLARMIRFEILSFIERRDAFKSDFFLNLIRGISPVTGSADKVKQTSHGTVHIKVRSVNEQSAEDEGLEQDPEIKELEKEIENELEEAGVTSKRDIEVHFITSSKSDMKFSESDARHFKEALIEIMGGATIEEREKERFNRILDNYNMFYKDSDAQFVIRKKDDESSSKS